MEIVKVQRPLMSSVTEAPWLVYAEGRDRVEMVPEAKITDAVKKAMADDMRAYFVAEWSSDNGWSLKDRVSDHDW